MKHVLKFELSDTTKGALLYKQVEQDGVPIRDTARPDESLVGKVYFRKVQVQGQPETCTVTVEFPE